MTSFELLEIPISGTTLNNFQCFFQITLIALSHGSNITNLIHYSLPFSECENDSFIVHEFLSNKGSKSSKSPHQNGETLNKEILWLEKLIQISAARTVTICDMHKPNRCFCISLDSLGEINFRPKLLLKKSKFLHENCRFGKKGRSKVVGIFRKFGEWRVETFSGQSKTQTLSNMAVINTNQWVSMEKVWLFSVAPLFNVAELNGRN